MTKPQVVGFLRRRGLWALAVRARRALAPPLCTAIHRVVSVHNPRLLPVNLVLKHAYDYRLIDVDPANIGFILTTGAWKSGRQGQPTGTRIRNWYSLGGGWKSVRSHVSRNFYGRFVADGDWDSRQIPWILNPVVVQLFRDGVPPELTDDYRKYAAKIEAGDLARTRGRSIEELDAFFSRLIDIFEDMQANGYRTQLEIGEDGSDEIRVCIDRYGRIGLFGGGTHRLSMARLLQLKRVPVVLKRVHSVWVEDWMKRIGLEDPIAAIESGVASIEAGSINRLAR